MPIDRRGVVFEAFARARRVDHIAPPLPAREPHGSVSIGQAAGGGGGAVTVIGGVGGFGGIGRQITLNVNVNEGASNYYYDATVGQWMRRRQ